MLDAPNLPVPAEAAAAAPAAHDDDPLWYKDAIIYQAHVKSFFDSNNDGIGDFQGLTQKLDYLQSLGITCLWLLPFFPVAAQGRRLRHRRLPERPSELRHARRLQGVRARRARRATSRC